MKVIIAGGRDFNDYQYLFEVMVYHLESNSITEVVSGKARGADSLGERWGIANNIPVKEFPAQWETLGKRAGYVRNAEMADYADMLVAFWDKRSKGTRHMIDLATKKGLYVHVYYY